jgi:hypothetical protein
MVFSPDKESRPQHRADTAGNSVGFDYLQTAPVQYACDTHAPNKLVLRGRKGNVHENIRQVKVVIGDYRWRRQLRIKPELNSPDYHC